MLVSRCFHQAAIALLVMGVAVPLVTARVVRAGGLTTQSGFSISGQPVEVEGLSISAARQTRGPVNIEHLWMVDDGMRRTFVPKRQVGDGAVTADNLITVDEFELRREKSSRAIGPSIVGSYLEKTPFDEHGRRRVTLNGGERGPIHILQEITKLRPDIITVNSTSHRWTHALTTDALDSELLMSLIKQATDSSSSLDRLRVIKFLVDAKRYPVAQRELAAFREDFPEMKERADQLEEQLNFYIARMAIGEVQQRRRAGQHEFAYAYAHKFPIDRISADVQQEVRALINDFETQQQKIETARMLLGQLQGELSEEQSQSVGPMRSMVCDELNEDTIDRLEPFLRAERDDTLTAEEKLGLAYTGWLLGDARAETSLSHAIRLWRARFLIIEILRNNSEVDRQAAMRELASIDGASVEVVTAMIPRLPLPIETGRIEPGVPTTVELATDNDAAPIQYTYVVPPEYSPGRAYPVLIALRPQGMSCEQILHWWAGTVDQPGSAMKHGYIVVAPEYADQDTEHYTYNETAHQAVKSALNDVRKRVQVDSDRVFLSGHGMGGDAAFDIGMSHPDLFAGVLPIVGVCEQYCKIYWQNCPNLAWFIVAGERDRNTLETNAPVLNRMMIRGYDVTYVEYMERGYESYFEERQRMFDWMALHRRAAEPAEFEVDVLRPADAHLYWVEANDFSEDALQPVAWSGGRMQVRPQPIKARITPGGTISVRSGAARTTIKLSPTLIDFDERIPINLGSRRVSNDIIEPDLSALLGDLRERGDRQRLYWARLEF